MCGEIWSNLAMFDDHDGNARILLDSELQHEVNESNDWGDDYEGGFVYSGDSSMYEGLTIIECPHIDGNGSVSAMPLYNHE